MVRFDDLPPEVRTAMCTPMHEILPPSPPSSGALWLGSLAAVIDDGLLREHGIQHVVQVLDTPWLAELPPGVASYRMDVIDVASADLRPHLEGACDDIQRALGRGENVLVHCHQVHSCLPLLRSAPCLIRYPPQWGVSRSASVVIAYLICKRSMTYEDAHALVKAKRACIEPNSGFVSCLQEWEKRWRPNAQAPMVHCPITS